MTNGEWQMVNNEGQMTHERAGQAKRQWRSGSILLTLAIVWYLIGGGIFGAIFLLNQSTSGGISLAEVVPWPLPGSDEDNGMALSCAPAGPDDRINVLILGVDERVGEKGTPTRSDTLMVVSFDTFSGSGAILSIPRDLWVSIPDLAAKGITEDRINTPNLYGDLYRLPGGGPALAVKTVSQLLGVPIHYTVRINFTGFVQAIDAIGGIDVEVPRRIVDTEYPTDDYETTTVIFEAGWQHLDGARALQYARTRHADSDFGRLQRQQQVILAAREKALRPEMIARLPALASTAKDSVQTDMPLTKMIALAPLARQVDPARIVARTIDASLVIPETTSKGASILLPKTAEIRRLAADLFFEPRARERQLQLREENALVIVEGSDPGPTVSRLQQAGFPNVQSQAGSSPRPTQVIAYGEQFPFSAACLARLVGLKPGQVRQVAPAGDGVGIRLILGQ